MTFMFTIVMVPHLCVCVCRRWLEYEKAHGDDASAAHVKRRAMEFVEGAVNA